MKCDPPIAGRMFWFAVWRSASSKSFYISCYELHSSGFITQETGTNFLLSCRCKDGCLIPGKIKHSQDLRWITGQEPKYWRNRSISRAALERISFSVGILWTTSRILVRRKSVRPSRSWTSSCLERTSHKIMMLFYYKTQAASQKLHFIPTTRTIPTLKFVVEIWEIKNPHKTVCTVLQIPNTGLRLE